MATFGDRMALLYWNYTLLASDYHSYHVERSTDNGRHFRQITDLPVTPFSPQAPEMFYKDSLPDNEQTFHYRIYGINSFGQKGPFSDTVHGKGVEKAECQPAITYGFFPAQNLATVGWELNCADTGKIDSLTILQSTKVDGRFLPVTGNIAPGLTKYTFPLTDETNYLQLCVRFRNGASQCSFPYMIRQTDSIPPAVPQGLQVEIDSAGIAHLSWKANTEKDFMAYRVLRSFYEKEEKSVVTPQLIHTNSFTDTLSLQTINLKVYYQVTALDHRYNESAPCEAVMALKPDNIPLIEPLFKFYEVEKGCISLSWITDPNDDATYYLFRKQYRDTVPETFIFRSDHRVSQYKDCPPETGTYEYKLMATDSAHHVAFSPKPAVAFIEVEKAALKVSGLSAFRDAESKYIELTWQRHPKARAYRIYRNETGQPMSLLKETEASVTKFVDELILPATDYQYTILIVPEKPERCATQSIIVKY
jgi:fibronectin type 3 domain-containing protein